MMSNKENEVGAIFVLIDANEDGSVNDMRLKGGANQLLSCAYAVIENVANEVGDDAGTLLQVMLDTYKDKFEGDKK